MDKVSDSVNSDDSNRNNEDIFYTAMDHMGCQK